MTRIPRGFTLLETLIAVTVVAVLACIAIPVWSGAREAAHSGAAQSALLRSILASVSRAALTGRDVVLCPGDPAGCRPTIDWSRGWIAYVDLDGDRVRDPDEQLLEQVGPLGGRAHLRSTPGRTRLVFQPNGGNAGSNVTFTLCDGRGAHKATTLLLNNEGRLRASTPTANAASACMTEL